MEKNVAKEVHILSPGYEPLCYVSDIVDKKNSENVQKKIKLLMEILFILIKLNIGLRH